MGKSLLITRPNHDHPTNYLYIWSEAVIKEAEEKRFDVYDLSGKKANKKTFDSYVKLQKPGIIFLNGHGDGNSITGYDNEILLKVGDSKILDENIVYSRSCEAAINLGKELVSKGARAFVGYFRKFNVGYTPSKIFKPLEDSLARLFLEPSNLLVTTIIKGHDVNTANKRSKDAMFKNFIKMISTTATHEERFAASWLWGNIKSQTIYGDTKARV
jgi:hypothetical protein